MKLIDFATGKNSTSILELIKKYESSKKASGDDNKANECNTEMEPTKMRSVSK